MVEGNLRARYFGQPRYFYIDGHLLEDGEVIEFFHEGAFHQATIHVLDWEAPVNKFTMECADYPTMRLDDLVGHTSTGEKARYDL